eukprot:CAMPEP_0170066130 /NCGR_PEP_ID=MMETSP0019_2-20121128/5939_1 /TAXON_ID=98059 /ORGANISM="Dinobryon sp., Strain UTEXLB2267" /LENGTH=608 /DNA_ID=CAMNT_0010273135 /DNA_START=228 /DNA_END=2054 /DNA_ORIENTATION=+
MRKRLQDIIDEIDLNANPEDGQKLKYLVSLQLIGNVTLDHLRHFEDAMPCDNDKIALNLKSMRDAISLYYKNDSIELLQECNLILDSYLQSILLPYFEDQNRYCSRMTSEWKETFPLHNNPNASILTTMNTSYSSIPARLVVTEFFVYSTARVIDGVGIVQSRRSLFCDSGNVSLEPLRTVFNGAGGFSYDDMTHIRLPPSGNSTTQEWNFPWRHALTEYNSIVASAGLSLVERIHPFSLGSNVPLLQYDDISIVAAMNGSRAAFLDHFAELEHQMRWKVPFLIDDQCEHVKSFLIMGLGSGDFHMFLLNNFNCIAVDSVEVNSDVLDISESYLGLEHGVCHVLQLNSSEIDQNFSRSGKHLSTIRMSQHPNINIPCRSRVIIADGWEYVHHLVDFRTANTVQSPNEDMEVNVNSDGSTGNEYYHVFNKVETAYYDLIMVDIYTMLSASWDGEIDKGHSNAYVERASSLQALSAMRQLLRPYEGMAFFHLHRDSSYLEYLDRILSVFGSSQTVVLGVMSNDNIVVVARDAYRDRRDANQRDNKPGNVRNESKSYTLHKRYHSRDHPCESAMAFSEFVLDFSKKSNFSNMIALEGYLALDCNSYNAIIS